jgi:hypothetical protein
MNLCDDTVSVLKNFATINPSIEFKPGNIVKTVSPQKSIMAEATIKESFPSGGAIYDLNRFLGTLSLFEDPVINWGDRQAVISGSKKQVRYTFADPSMIVAAPDKRIELPSIDLKTQVMYDDLLSVAKASSVLQLPEVALVGSEGRLTMQALDSKNPTADDFHVELVGTTSSKFRFIFKTENLKLMNLNYDVEVTSKGIARFTSTNDSGPKLIYWIALESSSTFE